MMLVTLSSMATCSIQTLEPHPLLHLEKGFFGSFPSFGGAGASGSVPFPPPAFGLDTLGAPGTSTMAPLYGTQPEASRPSAVEVLAHSTAAAIFGSHPGVHDWDDRTSSDATGNGGNGQ